MDEQLKDEYDDVATLLDDAVAAGSGLDSWEERGIEYRIDGDEVAYGRPFTERLLNLGYVPVSCTSERLVVSPIRPSSGD